jgi:hypothetical protein
LRCGTAWIGGYHVRFNDGIGYRLLSLHTELPDWDPILSL